MALCHCTAVLGPRVGHIAPSNMYHDQIHKGKSKCRHKDNISDCISLFLKVKACQLSQQRQMTSLRGRNVQPDDVQSYIVMVEVIKENKG